MATVCAGLRPAPCDGFLEVLATSMPAAYLFVPVSRPESSGSLLSKTSTRVFQARFPDGLEEPAPSRRLIRRRKQSCMGHGGPR